MEIKILSPEEVEFKEKDIQRAFEQDLTKLEDGLELIVSEVTIGTGRIDTLAFDTINSRPVFIEYKRQGEFGKDALIQLMDYLSWFARKDRVFAKLHFRKRYIQLELRVGQGKVKDSDFKYWRQGASSWGYTTIYPSKGIPEKVMGWIDTARNSSSEIEEDEDDEGQQ